MYLARINVQYVLIMQETVPPFLSTMHACLCNYAKQILSFLLDIIFIEEIRSYIRNHYFEPMPYKLSTELVELISVLKIRVESWSVTSLK